MTSVEFARYDDFALLRKFFEEGDKEAYNALVIRHRDMVYSRCLRYTYNADLAEDATQTVFIMLLQKGETIKKDVGGWLYMSAKYASISAMRKETSSEKLKNKLEENPSMFTGNENADSDNNEAVENAIPHIDDAIDSLKPKHQQMIRMRYFDGKAYKEIGEAMGVSEDAARFSVNRTTNRLKKFLKDRGIHIGGAALLLLLNNRMVSASPSASCQSSLLIDQAGSPLDKMLAGDPCIKVSEFTVNNTVQLMASAQLKATLLSLITPVLGIIAVTGAALVYHVNTSNSKTITPTEVATVKPVAEKPVVTEPTPEPVKPKKSAIVKPKFKVLTPEEEKRVGTYAWMVYNNFVRGHLLSKLNLSHDQYMAIRKLFQTDIQQVYQGYMQRLMVCRECSITAWRSGKYKRFVYAQFCIEAETTVNNQFRIKDKIAAELNEEQKKKYLAGFSLLEEYAKNMRPKILTGKVDRVPAHNYYNDTVAQLDEILSKKP